MTYNANNPRGDFLWWKEETDPHKKIFELVSFLHQNQTDRIDRNVRSVSLYGSNQNVTGPFTYVKMRNPSMPENRVKINIISSMCDTVSAKISKIKPRVRFLTEGGSWHLQEEAKKLDKFVNGAFYENDIYRLHQQAFKDSTILDIGAIKHYAKDGRIHSERVLAQELYFDDADSLYGRPTHMYQVKYVHKEALKEMFPKAAAAIQMSTHTFENSIVTENIMQDYVVVMEAWHLGKKYGRRVLCIENHTLEDRPYKKDYFPFTFFRWSHAVVGFVGQSLAERLTGNQIEINKMLRIIQRSFHLGSAFKVFLEFGSKVAREQINNEIGSIIYYSGQPPSFHVPKTVHSEYFQHLQWLIRQSYEEAGISQLSAGSHKPSGLDAAVALREFQDIESERFAIVSQEYENSFPCTAKQYIDLAKDITRGGKSYVVKAESKRLIESIDFADIAVEDNGYIMKAFPVSSLPSQPAGRLQKVQEMAEAGFLDQEEAIQLLDFPDLERRTSLKKAVVDSIMTAIDTIIYKGEYTAPEPFQDLRRGLVYFQAAYLWAKDQSVPEDRLEMLRRWMVQAKALQDAGGGAQMPDVQGQNTAVPGQVDPSSMGPGGGGGFG